MGQLKHLFVPSNRSATAGNGRVEEAMKQAREP
jgi:hypothetical protein